VLPRKYTEVGELSISKSSNRYMKNRISGLKKRKEKKLNKRRHAQTVLSAVPLIHILALCYLGEHTFVIIKELKT